MMINPPEPHWPRHLRPGDIMACWGRDTISRVITCGTWSPFGPAGLRLGPSHLAIICEIEGKLRWVESTMLAPTACVLRGEQVNGVQVHEPAERVQDYDDQGGQVVRYSLTAINRLSEAESELLTWILVEHFVKKSVAYDVGGALISGTRVWQLMRSFPGADLDRLFCSELVSAVLQRLGRLNRTNPTRHNPARLLREAVRQGVYKDRGRVRV